MTVPSDRPADYRTALAIRQETALSTYVAAPTSPELDDSLHLRDLLRIILKRKWWILSAAALLFGLALLWTLLQTPIYRATATIQIDRTAARVVDFKNSGSSGDEYSYDEREFLAT